MTKMDSMRHLLLTMRARVDLLARVADLFGRKGVLAEDIHMQRMGADEMQLLLVFPCDAHSYPLLFEQLRRLTDTIAIVDLDAEQGTRAG